jgi:hypothetical protein
MNADNDLWLTSADNTLPMPEWNPVIRTLKVSALLLVIVALFYWRLTLTDQYDWMWSPDLAGQVLPWFQAQALQWHRHGFPMWDQYMWNGQPLLGQAQPGAAYPLNWLMFLMPLDAAGHLRSGVLAWYFIAMHFMAAAFCYRLCRDLGRSFAASIFAGMIFTFAGYVGNTDWPQMVNGAVWMPMIFLYVLRAGAGKRPLANGTLAGLFLGMAWLSGHHQVVLFTSLAVVGTWTFFALRSGPINWTIVRAAAVSLVFTGLVGAMQILPALEYGHLAKRWVGAPDSVAWNQPVPYYVHEKYSLAPPSLFGIVFAGAHDGVDPFVGIVALSLAALAIAACWKDWRVRVLASVALGGIVYAVGGFSVFQGVLYGLVPSLDKARAPSVASAIFGFGVAVLAAFGLDRWREDQPTPWTRKVALSAAGFGILCGAACLVVLIYNKLSWQGDTRPPLDIFIPLGLAALLLALPAGNLTRNSAAVLACLLLVFELYQGSTSSAAFAVRADSNRDRYTLNTTGNGDIAGFLHGRQGIQRTEVPNEAFLANWGAYWDVPVWEGYLASVTTNVLQFENHTENARKYWGVAYQVAAAPTPYASQQIFAGASGMKVFWQPDAFPRAWSVHHITRIQSENQLNWYVANQLPLLHSEGLMYTAPPPMPPAPCPGDEVQLKEDQGSRVGISANLKCDGMVVVSDTYYPGWSAWIDGKPTQIYEVNGAMRGVTVPAGQHSITMRYRPMVVFEGAALTLLGLVGAVLLARSRIS